MFRKTVSKIKVTISLLVIFALVMSFSVTSFASYVPGGMSTGNASWFDGEGKMGAAEVILHSRAAAHMDAPFFIWCTVVRNGDGDPEVDVQILDRGNFPAGVEIDLVVSAFDQIGDLVEGYIDVNVFWQ